MYTHTRAPEGACRVTLSCDKHFVLNRPRLSYGWKAGPKAAGSRSFWSMISLFPSLRLSGSLSRRRDHCVDLLLRRAGVRSRSPLTQQQPRQPAREGKGHWKSSQPKTAKPKSLSQTHIRITQRELAGCPRLMCVFISFLCPFSFVLCPQ